MEKCVSGEGRENRADERDKIESLGSQLSSRIYSFFLQKQFKNVTLFK